MKVSECQKCSFYQKRCNVSHCTYALKQCSRVSERNCIKYQHLREKWRTHRWDDERRMFILIEDMEGRK